MANGNILYIPIYCMIKDYWQDLFLFIYFLLLILFLQLFSASGIKEKYLTTFFKEEHNIKTHLQVYVCSKIL